MSDDFNIGMAAGFGAANAAAQSRATQDTVHANAMADIERRKVAQDAAHSDKLHMIEKMILVKRWQSYAAWLKMGLFVHKTEKKVVIDELRRVDPNNNIAKKAQENGFSNELYNSIKNNPEENEKYTQIVINEIDKVIK